MKNPYPVPMTLLHILDLLSTFIFALVGARVAADKGLDYGGIAFIAGIASVSGGTLRNVFLGMRPIWIIDPWIIASVIAAVVITLTWAVMPWLTQIFNRWLHHPASIEIQGRK